MTETNAASGETVADHQRWISEAEAAVQHISRVDWLPLEWKGLRVDAIASASELHEALRLRHVAYADCGFIAPEDFPLGREVDRFDASSVHFAARRADTGEMVGYTRFLTGTTLQVEEMVDIGDFRRTYGDSMWEMSRLIVHPTHVRYVGRAIRHVAYRWAEANGVTMLVGVSPENAEDAFTRRMFLPMTPRRSYEYPGGHFRRLTGVRLYANYFDVADNRDHIRSLLEA